MALPQTQTPDVVLSAALPQQARSVLTLLVLHALDGLPKRTTFSLPADLLRRIALGAHLEADLKTLAQTTFSWDDSDGAWGTAALLTYAGVSAGRLSFAFSPVMAQMLAHAPGQARVQLAIQRRISSGHSLALYELCAPWSGRGRTPWWPVEQVRAALGLGDSSYYQTYKHFNSKVLKPALEDLSEHSDLRISPITQRQGRSVARLRFDVRQAGAFTMCDVPGDVHPGAVDMLTGLGVSVRLARHLVRVLDASAVQALLQPIRREPIKARAARLAVIHRLVSARSPGERDADKSAFLKSLPNAVDRADFERFAWMSSRNATAICQFWEARAPDAFLSTPQTQT